MHSAKANNKTSAQHNVVPIAYHYTNDVRECSVVNFSTRYVIGVGSTGHLKMIVYIKLIFNKPLWDPLNVLLSFNSS